MIDKIRSLHDVLENIYRHRSVDASILILSSAFESISKKEKKRNLNSVMECNIVNIFLFVPEKSILIGVKFMILFFFNFLYILCDVCVYVFVPV